MKKMCGLILAIGLLSGSLAQGQDPSSKQPSRTTPSAPARRALTKTLVDEWLLNASGYYRAINLQRQLKLPLVLYFCTDFVGVCPDLDNKYLATAPVREFLQGVVKVRIDPEHGAPERNLAKRYKVDGYPTFLVINELLSVPRNINPYRAGQPNMTPAQFADACLRATSSVPGNGANGPSTVTDPMTTRAVADATRQSTSSQIVELKPRSKLPVSSSRRSETEVDAILKSYAKAVGEDAREFSTRVGKAEIDNGVILGGRLELYYKANKSLKIIRVKPFGAIRRGFDGKSKWEFAEKNALEMKEAAKLFEIVANIEHYSEAKLKQLYPRMKLVGSMRDGLHEVNALEASTKSGTIETFYFDVQSGLLTHRTIAQPQSAGGARTEIYYSDWRDVDGIKVPFKVAHWTANGSFIIRFKVIRHNEPLAEALFRRPIPRRVTTDQSTAPAKPISSTRQSMR